MYLTFVLFPLICVTCALRDLCGFCHLEVTPPLHHIVMFLAISSFILITVSFLSVIKSTNSLQQPMVFGRLIASNNSLRTVHRGTDQMLL